MKQPTAKPRPKFVDEKHISSEGRDWTKVQNVEKAVAANLHHYNYYNDTKDAIAWVVAWVKKNRPGDLKAYLAAENWRTSMNLGALCKMHNDGAALPEKWVNRINTRIDEIVNIGKEDIEAEKKTSTTAEAPPTENKNELIPTFEEVLDKWKENADFSFYEEMKKQNVAATLAKVVIDRYTPLLNEISELVSKKTPELVEGYRNLSVRERSQYLKFIQRIIDDANLYINSKKATRKPRAKKTVAASAQVSKLQFQKECPTYKVSSVDPLNIIGANEVYLFNTKYRTITRLVSAQETGFTVKGTTIYGFDETKSFKKKIRKPEEFFNDNLKSTRARLAKAFESIKTTQSAAVGRTNEETILLKAYK